MIYNFYKKSKQLFTCTTDVGIISTSVGEYTGFTFIRNGEEFKVFYYNLVSGVVIEDKYEYVMEISINEL